MQHLSDTETRTVSFAYGANGVMTMTYIGRMWTYGPYTATDPTGATWTITGGTATPPLEYEAEAQTYTLTTPTGGWVRYLIVYHDECEPAPWSDPPLPPPPCEARWLTSVVRQRDTGGADVTPATLTFEYQSTDAEWTHVDTAVTGTNGTNYWADHTYGKVSGPYLPHDNEHVLETTEGPGPSQTDYLVTQCTVNGQIEQEWVADHWEYLSRNWFPVVTGRTTTQDGKTYAQQWTDMSCTWGQPLTVVESGDYTRTTTYAYETTTGSTYRAPRPTSIDVQGLTTTMQYEPYTGFMTSRMAAGIQTLFAPDAHGNVATKVVIDALATNHTQTTTFDHDRGVVSGTHTPLTDVTMIINEDGSVATSTQTGRTTHATRGTQYTYDEAGRLTSVQTPAGSSLSYPTQIEYATDHSWVKVFRGTTSTWTCVDGFGRTKATIATAGQRNGSDIFVRTDTSYDGLGRVAYTSLPYETILAPSTTCPAAQGDHPGTSFEYDGLGRVTKRTNPPLENESATFVTMDYTTPTGQSPRVAVTDENGHTTTQVFEATGSPSNTRLHTFTDAAGNTTTYGYDGFGNLSTLTSPTQTTAPTSVTRHWYYDANNRLDHQIQPESGTTTYHYDGFGRLWYQVDALGRQGTYTYDDENRLTDVVTSPDSAYWLHADYDEWGNRVLAHNGYVTSTSEYDADHRLTRRTDAINNRTFESRYQYDQNDRLTDVWYPSGNHVAYAYPHDRLSLVYDTTRNLEFATGFDFHPSGGLASYTTGNGIVHSITYDARYRPEHITGSGSALDLTYQYDGVGNVTDIVDPRSNQTSHFTYDALDRLETATGGWGSLGWSYDAIGNRQSQTKTDLNNNAVQTAYVYTTANRLDHTTTGSQTETFQHNTAGLLGSDGRGSYLYTPNNLQEQANPTAGGTMYYRYDADGQRVWKILGSDVSSTYYLHGPLGVLSEFAGSAGLLGWSVDYIYAAGRLIAVTRPPAGAWHTLTVMHQGGAGTVTSSPAGLDCGSACTGRFTLQSVVTLTATPGAGQTFSGWSGACTGTALTTTVTISGDLSCTAWFSTNPQLTLTKTGSGSGTMSTDPTSVSCDTTCAAGFTPGATVTLHETPASGSRFAGWSGDGDCADGSVTMGASVACTATFIRTYTLTVTKTGDGAVESLVTSDLAGISCGGTCSATYDSGTSVTLTAEAAEGYEFEGWSGTGCSGGGSTVTVTMDQARSCMAVFAAVPPPGCGPGDESACVHDGGSWEPESCTCNYWWEDPLVIPLDGHSVRLTGVAGGVVLDVNGDGVPDRLAWTVAGAREGFLVLDRNGNGVVDDLSELFGQAVTGRRHPEGPANSFTLLAAYDRPENGGNGDGVISAADAVFSQLRLWVDANHDGVSQPGELITLTQAGITSIELAAQSTGRRDRFGNYFRTRAVVHLANGQQTTVWDVFLAARINTGARASAALSWAVGQGTGPIHAGLAGLGASLIAVGLIALMRPRRRARSVRASGLLLSAVARTGVTGVTTLAVVLLWPSASFGQTWQVVEYYDTDAVGSVRAVTNAQGQVIARHDFLPFGEELAPQNEPPDKRLFTGQERDFETGQDYFGARQLRTDLGRFLAPDPMTLVPRVVGSQGVNSYAYVRNNPLRLIDPNGLDPRYLEDQPIEVHDWSPTMLFGGNTEDSLDEVFDVADTREAIDTLRAAAGDSDETAQNGGVHPATREETAKILAAAQTIVKMQLKYSDIVCTTFVMKAIDDAFPGAVHNNLTKDFVLQFRPVSEPHVGGVMAFKDPAHVVFVTGVENGQVTQFLGSQSKTGPAYVNLPQFYWSQRITPTNVTYYDILLPNR